MSLADQLFTMRRTGDYSDRFNLDKDEIVGKVEPTKAFIDLVTDLARKELEKIE